MQAHIKKHGALVDVRSPQEYTGERCTCPTIRNEGALRGGHIPGAASIPWAQAVKEDGTFKTAEDLNALYEGKGVTPDKDIIAYCRIGERSSHTWFVLKQSLGLQECEKLRWQLDRMGQQRRVADREVSLKSNRW